MDQKVGTWKKFGCSRHGSLVVLSDYPFIGPSSTACYGTLWISHDFKRDEIRERRLAAQINTECTTILIPEEISKINPNSYCILSKLSEEKLESRCVFMVCTNNKEITATGWVVWLMSLTFDTSRFFFPSFKHFGELFRRKLTIVIPRNSLFLYMN